METRSFLAATCLFLTLNGIASSSPAANVYCPDRCDCQHRHHLVCANRGLRAVPKPAAHAQVSEEVSIFSLGGNFIGNISASDFTRYRNLVRLNLQYNQIENVQPEAFEELARLEELYLGHNLISDLPAGTLQPLKKLTVLYGNDNDIRTISPELFANLDRLVKLRLDGNSIEDLQDSVFKGLTSLRYLHLESNKLKFIHKSAFSKLTNLRFLNLAHNKQSAVRNSLTFSQLKALTTLLLSENEIRHVGNHVFQNLKKLSKLSLSDNRISRLDSRALKGLSSLRELLVDGNDLEEIPAGLFDSLERIEKLDLSRNRISHVDSRAFSKLKHLKVLKLKNNMLTSLSGGIFALNNVLYDLDLHGNNWTCDCRLEELKRWMSAAHSRGKLLTVIVQCRHPESLRGKYLDYVNGSQLQPLGNWTQRCRRPAGPEESRGGDVLVKVKDRRTEPGDSTKQGVKAGGGEVRGEGGKEEAIIGKEGERQEEVRIQGDQGDVAVAGKKTRNDLLRPRSRPSAGAASKQASGRRRSNVIFRTDAPAVSQPRENTTDPHTGLAAASPVQPGEKFDLLRSEEDDALPVITDPCVFNRQFITDVSVANVTSSTASVRWAARDHRRYTPGPGPGPSLDEVHYRVLFDRFGTPDRFPRYVYTRDAAHAVTLRELSADATYMVCVEGVVGRSVCQVAPRDHCTGLVTLPEGSGRGGLLTSDLQLVTVATLAGNGVLLLVIGCAWLGRSLRRRLQRRKSAVHVRHMYSTRRPFRPAMATASLSTDFTSYQSGRPARLAPLEEGDLIEFPCERFLDTNSIRRDADMQRFSD
ncbi:TLR4 interactor with leucine rich repeats [Brachionichthys hirsutus]|uniref:TLR4 interactor with leucine rich repeats n=1 Tax=Brachionichthys hirsutus TaxID=412623 RepID=UPI0036045483